MGDINSMDGAHKPLQLTVGTGRCGPKTMRLREDKNAIESAGFYFPDHISFTPEFWGRYLWESGALKAKNLFEARVKINKHEFTPEEKGMIRDSVFSLHPLLRRRLIIRSDEYAMGLGLATSKCTSVPFESKKKGFDWDLLLERVEENIKNVLASGFNGNLMEFKRIKGIEENMGIMIMPLFGEDIPLDPVNIKEPAYCPVLSINYLGKIYGKCLSSIGIGIGGANSNFGKHSFGLDVPFHDFFDFTPIHWRILLEESGTIKEMNIERYVDYLARIKSNTWDRLYPKMGMEINKMIDKLIEKTGPRWLEIVKEDVLRPIWVVVQSSPFEYREVEKPEVAEDSLVLKSDRVLGSKIVKTRKVKIIYNLEKEDNVEYNEKNKDYLLIVKPLLLRKLGELLPIESFSNAGGIVCIINDIESPVGTHLGGYFRELDIPIITFISSGEKIEERINNAGANAEYTLYANEFKKEGFLAIDK